MRRTHAIAVVLAALILPSKPGLAETPIQPGAAAMTAQTPLGQALPHGCISVSDNFSLNPDASRHSLVARVGTNAPCTFYFSAGDVYSGSGAFKVSCSSGGAANHPDYQGGQYPPVAQIPIPQPCATGATVTVSAGHPGQGGAVIAGTRAYVNTAQLRADTLYGKRSAGPSTYSIRYVSVGGWQDPGSTLVVPEAGLTVAPFGAFSLDPVGTTVTVSISDDVVAGGSFLFSICQKNSPDPRDYSCGHGHDDVTTGDVCYTGPKTLTGVIPGNAVWVTIWAATSPCPDSPTTGTLTVVG